jgi:hypothetical protein
MTSGDASTDDDDPNRERRKALRSRSLITLESAAAAIEED